jgi:putative ABC transport system permease protein
MLFFFYVYRSLVARLRANAITMLSVALFVAGCTLGLAFYFSLRGMAHTAPPENIIVLTRSATSEGGSMLPLDSARKVMLVEGIKKAGADPLAARELLTRVYIDAPDVNAYRAPVAIRGIDTHSFDVHHAKLVEGAMPAPNSLDILVGERAARQHADLKMGADVALPGGPAKVVGIFSAEGSPYEDEVWTQRSALELHVKAKVSTSVTLVAENASSVPELVARINANKDLNVLAAPLAKFREDKYALASLGRTVFILLCLLSVVAIAAIAMTMNAAAVIRLPEFAALAAIGIRRSFLGRLVVLESILLSLVGAAIGVGASQLIRAKIGIVEIQDTPLEVSGSVTFLLIALGLAMVVGLLGGLPSAIAIRRLDIVKSMR